MKQTVNNVDVVVEIECTFCHWVGEEDELLTQMVDNQHNPQDHTLYEEIVCPKCKTKEDLSYNRVSNKQ